MNCLTPQRITSALWLIVAALVGAQAASAQTTRIGQSGDLFEFHSSFWVSLHHTLYVSARAHGGHASRMTEMAVLGDTAGWAALTSAERTTWEEALSAYEDVFADLDLSFDSMAVAVKTQLVELSDHDRPKIQGPPGLVAVLQSAAPVYAKVWWPRHDAANRAWVEEVLPLLEEYGDAIRIGVTSAFRTSWPAEPIRVDLSPYTGWAGAYATEYPAHIMVSSVAENYKGSQGLEMLFHEALHTMEGALWDARRVARERIGQRIPYNVIHTIVFYTAGMVTAQAVEGHRPYYVVQGMVERGGGLSRYFPVLEREWQPYLDGTRPFAEAFDRVVDFLVQ